MQESETRRREGQIVRENEDLVRAIVVRFVAVSSPLFEDALQEGRIALLAASRDWNAEEEASLRTWAATRISWRVLQFVSAQGRPLGYRPRRATMQGGGGVHPGIESMDAPLASSLGDSKDFTLHDAIADEAASPEEAAIRTEEREHLTLMLLGLSHREVGVLVERFIFDSDNAEIGKLIGRSRERVRQIEEGALATLAKRMKAQQLKEVA
jgi:RNA polymerase sigma factor (sigma-70 family)